MWTIAPCDPSGSRATGMALVWPGRWTSALLPQPGGHDQARRSGPRRVDAGFPCSDPVEVLRGQSGIEDRGSPPFLGHLQQDRLFTGRQLADERCRDCDHRSGRDRLREGGGVCGVTLVLQADLNIGRSARVVADLNRRLRDTQAALVIDRERRVRDRSEGAGDCDFLVGRNGRRRPPDS
jgi:hypothetical protein